MKLQYEISATGESQLRRVVRGVEAELHAHARRSAAMVRQTTGTSRPTKPSELARGADQLGRAARAAYYREGREKLALEKRVEAEKLRGIKRAESAEIRAVKHVEAARIRAAQKDAAIRQRAAISMSRGIAGGIKNGARNLVGIGGGALALSGGFAAASAVQREIDISQRTARIATNARGFGTTGISNDEVRGAVRNTSLATGVSEDNLISGLEAAVAKTGDLAGALKDLGTIATVVQATGADTADAYLLQADAMKKFGLTQEQMGKAWATLIAQGKKGTFEMQAMATQAPKVFAAAAGFGFKGQAGLEQIGGMLQVARDVTGSDEQAAFATEAALRQLVSKSGALQSGAAFGGRKVQVFEGGDPRKGARGFRDILGDVLTQSRGNQTQLQEVFGEEGIRLMRPFMTKFREASSATPGTKAEKLLAGRNAALKILDDAAQVTGNWTDVQKDAQQMMGTTAAKLEVLKTKLGEVGSRLLPTFEKLIPAFEKMTPAIVDAADFMAMLAEKAAAHPWATVAAVIGAGITKEIAAAKLGDMIARLISGAGGAGGGAPIGGLGGRAVPVGALGAAGLAAGGVGLALNQADKLAKDTGTKGSAWSLLTGFDKKGDFSIDQLFKDMTDPLSAVKQRVDFLGALGKNTLGIATGSSIAKPTGQGGGTASENAAALQAERTKVAADQMAALAAAAKSATAELASVKGQLGLAANRTTPIIAR